MRLPKLSKRNSDKEKKDMLSLLRAIEQEGMDVTLSQLVDALLDLGCTCNLVPAPVLRLLAIASPLLIRTKAKELVVNLARAARLDTVMSTLSCYLCDDEKHVRLVAIAVLGVIVCTIEAREVHQHLTCSTLSLAKMMVELETIDEALGALKMV